MAHFQCTRLSAFHVARYGIIDDILALTLELSLNCCKSWFGVVSKVIEASSTGSGEYTRDPGEVVIEAPYVRVASQCLGSSLE